MAWLEWPSRASCVILGSRVSFRLRAAEHRGGHSGGLAGLRLKIIGGRFFGDGTHGWISLGWFENWLVDGRNRTIRP